MYDISPSVCRCFKQHFQHHSVEFHQTSRESFVGPFQSCSKIFIPCKIVIAVATNRKNVKNLLEHLLNTTGLKWNSLSPMVYRDCSNYIYWFKNMVASGWNQLLAHGPRVTLFQDCSYYKPLGLGLKVRYWNCADVSILFIKLSTKTYLTGVCYDLNDTEGELRVR